MKKTIYYHDTDCGGVVYYANYLKYFEEGRTGYFKERGITLKKLSGQGIFFVVAAVQIKYKRPAKYADELEIRTKVEMVKAASIDFSQEIVRSDELLVECLTKLVCVDKGFVPRAIPQEIASALA